MGGYAIAITLYICIILLVPYGSNFQMLLRFPTFFLGGVIGKLIKEHDKSCNNKLFLCILFVLFCIGLSLSIYAFIYCNPPCAVTVIPEIKKTGWLFIPYFLMVPFFCLLLCKIIEWKVSKPLLPFLKDVGVMSIEVYLLHGQFIVLTRTLTNEYGWSKPLVGAILITACFILCWYVHKFNTWIMDMLKTKKGKDS